MTRLAIAASHPIQYYAPLFRDLARRLDITVLYAHRAGPTDQAKAGFDIGFEWDIDLYSGYAHEFLQNVSRQPSLHRFDGCDTPGVAGRLRAGRFDALLTLGWHRKSFLQAIVAGKNLGIPVLARGDSHLATPRSTVKRVAKMALYPLLLRTFNAALYVGKHSYDYWRHYGFPPDRLFFSPHCVDTDRFEAAATDESRANIRTRLGIGHNAKVALFAGKLLPFKRPLDLVAAVAFLKTQGHNIEIIVAGSGPLSDRMIAAARVEGVTLHMLGFCNQMEMPAIYAAADILVLPSDGHETWGLVANEALACRRPIALSDAVGSAPDLVLDRSAGRMFPMGDVRALAATMRDILTTPPSQGAIAAKSEAYSIGSAADGIENALSSSKPTRLRLLQ